MTTDNPTTEAPSAAAGGETIEVTYSYDEVMRKISEGWDTAEAASQELDIDSVVAPRIEWGRNAFNFLMTNIEAHVNKQQATIASLQARLQAAEARERSISPDQETLALAYEDYVEHTSNGYDNDFLDFLLEFCDKGLSTTLENIAKQADLRATAEE